MGVKLAIKIMLAQYQSRASYHNLPPWPCNTPWGL